MHHTLFCYVMKSFWDGAWGRTFFKKSFPIDLTFFMDQNADMISTTMMITGRTKVA